MKILFASSEAHPFIKTGGLADVAYALPKSLRALGIDARVIIPKYGTIPEHLKSQMKKIKEFSFYLGWRKIYCGVEYIEYDGVPYYLIDNEYYFKRDAAYGYFDDGERFSYFSKAILEAMSQLGDFIPDIIHCNDWHTGMTAFLAKSYFYYVKTVFTIHNLKYQGCFNKNVMTDILGLGEEFFTEDKLKYYDAVSFMQGAINYSDAITTVSNSYSQEIRTPFYGEGLDGLLNRRSNELYGIVNGIDTDLFDPKTDKNLSFNYDENSYENKVKNKLDLQKTLGLQVSKDIPMIGMVTRLVDQKGFDLLDCIMEELLHENLQLVILGTGDYHYEEMLRYYSSKLPGKISANILFDNSLAQKIYASSDMFLMPSLFEPCGIGQLLSLRYGTIPIVRETGGLKDTVQPYNETTGTGNGFSFTNYNAHDMLYTIKRALSFYRDEEFWTNLAVRAMKEDNSWQKSAKMYINLYNHLIGC
jgi:starch synthase